MNANTERWQVLDDLFQRVSEMDHSLRDDFVRSACGCDAELRKELEALLAVADKTLGWLKKPVDNAARELAFTGRRIGSYILLRLLGEGGMGSVFLAARADEQYQQFVAIKMMHADLWQSEIMLERFRAERQILANLNHPNIARLLDGGMTPEGTPYLVMEYVAGVPLDEYCRANIVSVDKKLDLFLRICSAIEYAHKNLVVHRDIKPANVLVSDDGAPKLVDFGIAKLVDAEGTAAAKATTRLMTPEFASPEQLRGESITTATDVYGLGVLLYYLFSGTHPFAEHSGNPAEMMRRICEVEPQPPSSIASNVGDRRGSERDLDRIVLMAMQKQPERRYPSVTALARDVFAYNNGYPLFARTGGLGYRATKFVLRHKLMVGGLMLFAITLAGFSIEMAVLTQRANRERLKAEREATFLADMFRAASPQEARGRTITARELLDRGRDRVDKELASEPEVRASLLYNIGQSYSRLGFYDRAKEMAERSYEIRKQTLGPRDPATAESLFLLAFTTRINGEYAEAEPLFRQTLDIRRARLGDDSIPVADSLSSLGDCQFLEGKHEEAEANLRGALATFRRHGPNLGSSTRDYLARLLLRKGDYLEAVQLLTEAVEIDRRNEGINGPNYTITLHNLAGALWSVGDLYTAKAKATESLETKRRVLGNDHPDLGYPLNILGVVALDEGDWRKAEPLLRASFAIWSRHGPNHALTLTSSTNWARVLEAKGSYTEARPYFEHALSAAESQSDHTYYTGWVLSRFAVLELDVGNYLAAETKAERALTNERTRVSGDTAPSIAMTMVTLAEARLFQGDATSAETVLRRAVEILKGKLPANYPAVTTAEVRLGEALTAVGRASEAEPILREALASAHNPPFRIPAWQVGEAESALGWCLGVLGRRQEGIKFLQQSQQKLLNHPRPVFRRQANIHLQALLGHNRP